MTTTGRVIAAIWLTGFLLAAYFAGDVSDARAEAHLDRVQVHLQQEDPPPSTIYLPVINTSPDIYGPNPPSKAVDQSLNAYLTWEVLKPELRDAKFTVYLEANDETPDIAVAQGLSRMSFDPYTFAADTQYYWQVVAAPLSGPQVKSPIWTFRTDDFSESPLTGPMVTVPAGEFRMGCDPDNSGYTCLFNQVPLHAVYLDAFQIDKYEVTNKQYRECSDAGVCDLPRKLSSKTRENYFYNPDTDTFPVMFVSHWDAEAYCGWVGKRLPTEAEWEKAARGAIDTRPWPWGSEDWDCTRVNRCGAPEDWDSVSVDAYQSNQSPYGAVNMAGNMFEWVQDYFYDYYYKKSPYNNPINTKQHQEIPYFSIRGGSYHDNWWYARVNHRSGGHHGDFPGDDAPLFRSFRVGFRCAKSLPSE